MAQAISSNYGHFDDLVFDARNKSYGAYVIRQSYTTNIFIGFLIGVFIIGAVIAIPYIQSLFKVKKEVVLQKNVQMDMENIEPIKEKEEIIKVEEPKMDMVKFTVPIITTDEDVENVTQDDLMESNPGNITQEGNVDFTGIQGDGDETVGETHTDEVFTVVEQMPEFPGGEAAMNDFLDKNLQYPSMAKEQGIQGKVWIGFIVDKFGNVSNVEVLRGIGGGCDEEAARVVGIMPRWVPGKQSGRPVIVKFRFPINFTLR